MQKQNVVNILLSWCVVINETVVHWLARAVGKDVCCGFSPDWFLHKARTRRLYYARQDGDPRAGDSVLILKRDEDEPQWCRVLSTREVAPAKDPKFEVVRAMARDLNVDINELIEMNMVHENATGPVLSLRVVMFNGSQINVTFPNQVITVDPHPVIRPDPQLVTRFADLVKNGIDSCTVFAMADRVIEEAKETLTLEETDVAILKKAFNSKMVEGACRIVSKGQVRRIRSTVTGRIIMEVLSDTMEDKWYRVSSEWCQCPTYCFRARKNLESGIVHCCKHQLALRIALALQKCQEFRVSEYEFDSLLGYH